MKTDLYIKTALTTIALCLILLTLNNLNLVPKVYAESPVGEFAPANYGLVPLNEDGSISVSFAQKTLDVNVINAETSIDVNLSRMGGKKLPIRSGFDDFPYVWVREILPN